MSHWWALGPDGGVSMKKTLLVAAGATLFSTLAIAADLPVKSPGFAAAMTHNWTGLYVGGNVGYAWGHSDTSSTISCPTGGARSLIRQIFKTSTPCPPGRFRRVVLLA